MRKNIGSQLALYPMPVTVIGAMNGEKPTWTLGAHVGIIGHEAPGQPLRCAFHQRADQTDEKALYQPGRRGVAVEGGLRRLRQRGEAGQDFESFICSIDAVFVEEAHLTEKGKVDYRSLKPVLFESPTYKYLKTGDVLGKCLSFKDQAGV